MASELDRAALRGVQRRLSRKMITPAHRKRLEAEELRIAERVVRRVSSKLAHLERERAAAAGALRATNTPQERAAAMAKVRKAMQRTAELQNQAGPFRAVVDERLGRRERASAEARGLPCLNVRGALTGDLISNITDPIVINDKCYSTAAVAQFFRNELDKSKPKMPDRLGYVAMSELRTVVELLGKIIEQNKYPVYLNIGVYSTPPPLFRVEEVEEGIWKIRMELVAIPETEDPEATNSVSLEVRMFRRGRPTMIAKVSAYRRWNYVTTDVEFPRGFKRRTMQVFLNYVGSAGIVESEQDAHEWVHRLGVNLARHVRSQSPEQLVSGVTRAGGAVDYLNMMSS